MLRKAYCCCGYCILLLVLILGYSGYVWYYLKLVRDEDSALQGPFNDEGCSVVAKDLIRGGSSLALWKDGVVIVSAGDLNTTFRHYAQGAKGTGLFAVDLEAAGGPAVRQLELLDWPKGETLVGQGLFVSKASGRLYVVNHGRTHGEAVNEELTYKVGDLVQAHCCCCLDERLKWNEAQVMEVLGHGAYRVVWFTATKTLNTTAEVVFARQMRRAVYSHKWEEIFLADTSECEGSAGNADYSALTETECLFAQAYPLSGGALETMIGVGEPGVPFSEFRTDEPPGCYLLDGRRYFNQNRHVQRRMGRLTLCKMSVSLGKPEERVPPGEGKEGDGPESSVEIFEIQGDTYESLRLKHVDTIVDDLFPYQAISQVVEGRNESELFVLRELRWRSTSHEHNFAYGSRNRDPYREHSALHVHWFFRWLGLPSVARVVTWLDINNPIQRPGDSGSYRFRDGGNSPVLGDVNVVRCWQSAPHGLESDGVRVLGGRRWRCKRTQAHGLPKARGLTISPNRSDVLVGVQYTTLRYQIEQDGTLTEVGWPQFGSGSWIDGLAWQDDGKVLYSIQPGPTLLAKHFKNFLSGAGPPTELAVGEPPEENVGWLRWLFRSRGQHQTILRLDGDLFSGTSSWVRRGTVVLAGSDWEDGLLFCPSVKPPQNKTFLAGDRVWIREDPLFSPSASLAVFDTANKYRLQVESLQMYLLTVGEKLLRVLPGYATSTWHTGKVWVEDRSRPGSYFVVYDKAFGEPDKTRYGQWALTSVPRERLVPITDTAPPRVGEWVEARDATGAWRFAEVLEQDNATAVATLRWTNEVAGDWQLRSSFNEGEVRVSFSGSEYETDHREETAGEPYGKHEDGLTYGWVEGSGKPEAGAGKEGTCTTEDGGPCAPSQDTPARLWELALPVGFYEVRLLHEGERAKTMQCFVEGRQFQGTAAVLAHVLDGRLTLGGCMDGLVLLVATPVSEEEALATTFFKGALKGLSKIGRFEDESYVDSEKSFLRRLPGGLTADNVTLLATISGGSCGPKTVIRFEVDEETLRYFQHGITAGWRPLHRVRELTTHKALELPSGIWVGPFQNSRGCDFNPLREASLCQRGWGIGGFGHPRVFATRLDGGMCAGTAVQGGETIELSYLAGPPRPTPEKSVRKALGPAELHIRETGSDLPSVTPVFIKGYQADGAYVLDNDEKERQLPLVRVRRIQAAGYRRTMLSNSFHRCEGYLGLVTRVSTAMDCLRLCSARRRCRFAMWSFFEPENCWLSPDCEGTVVLGRTGDRPTELFEKL